MSNRFHLLHTDSGSAARTGLLETPHGEVRTPVFMPVGTQGAVKAVTPEDLETLGAEIILNNLYHIAARPGKELIKKAGSLHDFIGWKRPILTDSGGYQILSLSSLAKVTEEGVHFRSPLDGSSMFFSPESVVEMEAEIGVDVMMPLDHLIESTSPREQIRRALETTLRWEERAFKRYAQLAPPGTLFAITQGGIDPELRALSTRRALELPVGGIAIGGLSVGESKEEMGEMIRLTRSLVPPEVPLYLMGVGKPEDILEAVSLGIDMFDCVMPTRNARTGWLYTNQGKIVIKNARYAEDFRPLDEECGCYTCRNFSRAFLRHLYVSGEITYSILATRHNLAFYLDMMGKIRQAIAQNEFTGLKDSLLEKFNRKSIQGEI